MATVNRSIRLSQIISQFGVGAVYDILGESIVLTDISKWNTDPYFGKGDEIVAERLIKSLRLKGFTRLQSLHQPKKEKEGGSLPYMRFPRWLFCSKCRKMKKWSYDDEQPKKQPVCNCEKNMKLTPMRFITICEHGHMSDVDWKRWAHSRAADHGQKNCQKEDLQFVTGVSKSGGLESVAVKCKSCGSFRTLEGITVPDILKTIGVHCSGRQPWQSVQSASDCKSRIHVVQRGAGNVYYPVLASALTIPPESTSDRFIEAEDLYSLIREHRLFVYANSDITELRRKVRADICNQFGCTEHDIEIASGDETLETIGEVDIENEEWDALMTELNEVDDRDKFVTKHIPIEIFRGIDFSHYFHKIVSVIKLREVRTLTGFYRYQPGDSEGGNKVSPIKVDLSRGVDWLPATEVFGEGIFISLNEKTLCEWEKRPEILNRIAVLKERQVVSSFNSLLPPVTPRFVLLHTLAHLLIRRLAFECGYSSASLRERIYSKVQSGRNQAGFLIYTAAGDSEGTLGGLARLAENDRVQEIILSSLQDAANCSADPICMESISQGLDGLNLSACHACALVSETSCTSYNLLLDRSVVIGEDVGFLSGLILSALENSIQINEASIIQRSV